MVFGVDVQTGPEVSFARLFLSAFSSMVLSLPGHAQMRTFCAFRPKT